jgi:transcriptional regulator with XRE-family HTH domain
MKVHGSPATGAAGTVECRMPSSLAVRPPEHVDRAVGQRLRDLRQDRGISLVELSKAAGLSIGFLSQIERGISSPSLKALASIADALGLPIAALFGAGPTGEDPGTVVIQAADRATMQLWRSGIVKQLLTPGGQTSALNVYMIVLEPGADTGIEPYAHQGEEAGLVLEGTLGLSVEAETWTLGPGDSFRFESSRPHRFANAGTVEARVVWVNALPRG